jgi:DNA polymerase-3 subunit delta'
MRSSAASAERARRSAETLLAAAGEARLPHAVILQGPAVAVLEAFARRLAAVHLRAPLDGGHLDLLELRPAGKSRSIPVEHAREAVRFANLSSHSGRKLILIHEADCLRTDAANTFLKTLEEPPPGVLLVLLTSHPYRLLPTLLSRSARFDLGGESERLADPAWRDWLAAFAALLARAGDRSKPGAAPLLLAEAYGLLSRFEQCHAALVARAEEAEPFVDNLPADAAAERKELREAHETRLVRSVRAGMLAEMADAVRRLAREHPGWASAASGCLADLEDADRRAHRLNLQALLAVEVALLTMLRRLARG